MYQLLNRISFSKIKVFGIVFCLLSITSYSQSKVLDVKLHLQHTQVWCWAASIAMVAEYFSEIPIEDCQVLSLYDLELGGSGMCCYGDPTCVRPSSPFEIGPILGNIFGLHGTIFDRSLSWDEIVEQIDDDKPIIAWVWNSPMTAHVMVITGYYSNGSIRVLDPLLGVRKYPYIQFAGQYPNHLWNLTWTFNTTTPEDVFDKMSDEE